VYGGKKFLLFFQNGMKPNIQTYLQTAETLNTKVGNIFLWCYAKVNQAVKRKFITRKETTSEG
jgi:hypothetical protein